MKNYIKLFSVALIAFTLSNCKNDNLGLSEFKYEDKNLKVNCYEIDTLLLKEAVFSFEDDIAKHYSKNGNPNLSQAYSRTINLGIYGRAPYEQMLSDHSKAIFEILKTKEGLWTTTGNKTTLNYNHPLVKCLAENINDKDINTTFNALLSTNSMRIELLGAELRKKSSLALRDKYLATYIALDYYYAKLFSVDFEALEAQKKLNEAQKKSQTKIGNENNSHEGHNH